jgi:hypothetical protein
MKLINKKRYSMHAIYGLKPGETFWAASDLGIFKDLN